MHKSNFKNIFCISFVILDFQKDLWCHRISTFKKKSILMSFSHYLFCARKKISLKFRIPLRIPRRFWTFSDRCQNSFPVRISQMYGPAFLEPVQRQGPTQSKAFRACARRQPVRAGSGSGPCLSGTFPGLYSPTVYWLPARPANVQYKVILYMGLLLTSIHLCHNEILCTCFNNYMD